MVSAKKIKRAVKTGVSLLKTKRLIPIEHRISENVELKDKVALITGGTGGIGLSIAKSFVESGCKVIIVGRSKEKCQRCSEEVGDNCSFIAFDLEDTENIHQFIGNAVNIYGRIDILVNSAGVHSTKSLHDYFDVDTDEYDTIMTVNLKSTFFVSQAVAKYMVDNKIKGHILNISSSVQNEPAWSPYRLSKWGLKGLTAGLAEKLLPQGIIVNAIAPGSTATSLLGIKDGDSIYTDDNLVGRLVTPDEIATYAKILVSDLGNMVVGDTIYISGGRGTVTIR